MKIRTLRKASISKGTRVIVRADLDVAAHDSRIFDDFRILQNLPTIRLLARRGARVRIVAHCGRPHGTVVRRLTLKPFAAYLQKALKSRVLLVSDPFTAVAFEKYNSSDDILLFENIRFWPGEEKKSASFAKSLAKWGDIYVNEAFANSHRAHASMVALPRLLPSYAGLYLEKELSEFEPLVRRIRPGTGVVLGGGKLETKLPLIERFLSEGAEVCVAGALANSIFFAHGTTVGISPVEKDLIPRLRKIHIQNPHLHLPCDIRVARSISAKPRLTVPGTVRRNECIFDVGPATVANFAVVLRHMKTIFWNGWLGLAEIHQFSQGTKTFARLMPKLRAAKIVGGGDTIATLKKWRLLKGYTHVSTGGGAILELLAGKKLPGTEALKK